MASYAKFDLWQTTSGANYPTVIQVQSFIDNSYRSVALGGAGTVDWVAGSITRKLPTSKILVIFSGMFATSNNNDVDIRLLSSTDGYIGEGTGGNAQQCIMSPGTDKGYAQTAGSGTYSCIPGNFTYLHTPSSAIATVTYTVRINVEAAATVYPNGDGWRGGGTQAHQAGAHLTLMEIGN